MALGTPSEGMIAATTLRPPEVQVDRDLVERARTGDREAFAVLVHQVSDGLYAVAYRILRDTGLAEDALQNALVLAWRQLPKLRDPDRFEVARTDGISKRGEPSLRAVVRPPFEQHARCPHTGRKKVRD